MNQSKITCNAEEKTRLVFKIQPICNEKLARVNYANPSAIRKPLLGQRQKSQPESNYLVGGVVLFRIKYSMSLPNNKIAETRPPSRHRRMQMLNTLNMAHVCSAIRAHANHFFTHFVLFDIMFAT